jgi:hypothetical protein
MTRVEAARVAKETTGGSSAQVARGPREPDAPRPRGSLQTRDDRSTVRVEGDDGSQPARHGTASQPQLAGRPRSRAEVDNALHGIGLALDALLDGLTIPEDPADTTLLPIGRGPDVDERLRALLADAAIEVAELEVVAEGACVVIRGRVSDALVRLWVEDLVWSLPNVQDCDNCLAIG